MTPSRKSDSEMEARRRLPWLFEEPDPSAIGLRLISDAERIAAEMFRTGLPPGYSKAPEPWYDA